MNAVRKSRHVPFAVKQRMWALPCVICGRRDDIEVDHIVSPLEGGDSSQENLQPLCATCNKIKGRYRNNDDVRAWIIANPVKFKRSQDFRTMRLRLMYSREWF